MPDKRATVASLQREVDQMAEDISRIEDKLREVSNQPPSPERDKDKDETE